jgi:hypothetical protein
MGLDEATAQFADELTSLFSGVFDTPVVFEAFENQRNATPRRIVISKSGPGGIPIKIDDNIVFQLVLNYECSWNPVTEQMTVVESVFSVLLHGVKEPLWRYDFNRDMKSKVPVAHLNVHAHRDEIAWARSLTKRETSEEVKVRKLHFPFGGARFRPTIEDVLQMLIEEFNVDCTDDAKAHIETSRVKYFERQLTGAVMESPAIAIEALARLGFETKNVNSSALPRNSKARKTTW